ncbi:endospore germination permease [Paenibacillus sp. NPDC058071]|uniref:GerAB/ArcD/ProY family transporter n=1 Tax=Paenibacillus sp. NPDC058071 TaxID=3346326 RepID=UPI0036DD8000
MLKARITAAQLCILMFLSSSGTTIMASPSVSASFAGLDMWVAPIFGCIGGLIVIWTLIALHRLYPGMTIVQYAEAILGKYPGKALSLLVLFFIFYSTGFVVKQLIDFLSGSFYLLTPPIVLGACLTLVCAIAVKSGIEVIARLATFFFPLTCVILCVIIFPLYPDLVPISPFLEHGIGPPMTGGFALQLWFALFSFGAFYIPNVRQTPRTALWLSLSPILLCLLMIFVNWHIVSLLGSAALTYHYPFLVLTRYAAFSEFFEHMESLMMMVWVTAFFLRIIYGYYCGAVGLAQWLGLPRYEPIVLPAGMLLVAISVWNISTTQFGQTKDFELPLFYTLSGIVLPLLLLAAAWMRKAFTRAKPPAQAEEPGGGREEAAV